MSLIKNEDLLKAINLALFEFSNEFNVTSSKHFSNKLGFKNSSQFTNMFQLHNEKYIKVDELLKLMDNLGAHNKIILDFLCSRYDYTCSISANESCTNETLKDLLLSISGDNGSLINRFKTAISDNNIDDEEKQQLLNESNQIRSLLVEFENQLKEL
ncbi:MAG: hypothetical protein DRG78_03850 [Epsilonproteobacteria bacterium]|nr:MAG: hypothetical protein DRG78_03850 [Campylobacterota bacterium]